MPTINMRGTIKNLKIAKSQVYCKTNLVTQAPLSVKQSLYRNGVGNPCYIVPFRKHLYAS